MVKVRKLRRPAEPVERPAALKSGPFPEPKRPTAADRKAVLITFLDMLARGFTKDEIVQILGLETNQFEALLSRVYTDTEEEHSAKTPLRIFAEYVIKKNAILRDLEAQKNELRGKDKPEKAKKKWYNAQAFVMACRLQSEIIDQQVRTGQELGVIEKRPEGIILIDGRDPREMDEAELEDTLVRELAEADNLIKDKNAPVGKVLAFKTVAGKIERP